MKTGDEVLDMFKLIKDSVCLIKSWYMADLETGEALTLDSSILKKFYKGNKDVTTNPLTKLRVKSTVTRFGDKNYSFRLVAIGEGSPEQTFYTNVSVTVGCNNETYLMLELVTN